VTRWILAVGVLLTAAVLAAPNGEASRSPVISLSPKTPRVGERMTISVLGAATCDVVVAHSPLRHRFAIRLSRRAAVCRGMFRFPTSGQWTLSFGRVTRALRVRAALPTRHPLGAPLGRSNCEPSSPITVGRVGPPEAFGTTSSGQLWALFFHGTLTNDSSAVFSGLVGSELKLVLKRTAGVGLTTATAPDGTRRQPVWQRAHASSTWERPGVEYGTGWQITEPGCWLIHVGSPDTGADLWFRVLS
jgi:hypothetical protein